MKNVFFLIGFIAIFLFGCDKNIVPIASFQIFSSTIYVGQEFEATNLSTNAESYIWQDGHGMFETTKDLKYTYHEAGSYSIELTAIYGDNTDTYSQNVTILNPSLRITTQRSTGEFQNGTEIKIYDNYDDFINSANAILIGVTSSGGVKEFSEINPGKYYYDAIYKISNTEGWVNWDMNNP
ncbi:MAG: PKD domain-containing protein, partial [Bacteroidales bacterium]|nr:PKD domain-containing protein [Bacteroidales bacterium]